MMRLLKLCLSTGWLLNNIRHPNMVQQQLHNRQTPVLPSVTLQETQASNCHVNRSVCQQAEASINRRIWLLAAAKNYKKNWYVCTELEIKQLICSSDYFKPVKQRGNYEYHHISLPGLVVWKNSMRALHEWWSINHMIVAAKITQFCLMCSHWTVWCVRIELEQSIIQITLSW